MKVVVIGSGGREHAICNSLKNSKNVSKIYCIPGNAGTSLITENINIKLNDFQKIKDFILKNSIDLVIIGPEKPLVDGIVDYLEKFKIRRRKRKSRKKRKTRRTRRKRRRKRRTRRTRKRK